MDARAWGVAVIGASFSGSCCRISWSGWRTRPDQPTSPPGALRQYRSSIRGGAGGGLLQRFL